MRSCTSKRKRRWEIAALCLRKHVSDLEALGVSRNQTKCLQAVPDRQATQAMARLPNPPPAAEAIPTGPRCLCAYPHVASHRSQHKCTIRCGCKSMRTRRTSCVWTQRDRASKSYEPKEGSIGGCACTSSRGGVIDHETICGQLFKKPLPRVFILRARVANSHRLWHVPASDHEGQDQPQRIDVVLLNAAKWQQHGMASWHYVCSAFWN